jgi:hypothetical protein
MTNVTSNVNSPAGAVLESSQAPRAGAETHERLARALTAAFGSFAASSAVAARLAATERANAFQHMAAGFDERHEAMRLYTETLESNRGAIATAANGASEPPASTPAPRDSGEITPDSSTGRPVVSVKIPGLKRDIGLGDAVSKLTSVFGIVTCGACARRAEKLNKALVFRAPQEE